jgi:virginiamycin B lyase
VERWDADLTAVQASVELGAAEPGGMVAGDGSIWVSTGEGANSIVRVDTASNSVVARIPDVGYPFSLAFGAGSVWAPSYDDGTVARIDAASNTVTDRVKVSPDRAHSAVATDRAVWVTSYGADQVSVIDTATNLVSASTKVNLGGPTAIGLVGQGAWVAGAGQARGVTGHS